MADFDQLHLSRRCFLASAALLSGAVLLPPGFARGAQGGYAVPKATLAAMRKSPLVYITPLRTDGKESACHAEVWFAADGDDVLVVTVKEAWRSQAPKRGLDRARVWVGDFGAWKSAKGKFKSAPTFLAEVAHVGSDAGTVERALQTMGTKYEDEGWSKWGQRFREGLADGSRVLLRYRPVAG
jgi:hypothetical protein